jgi:two-component system, NarL family, response regulator DegU
MQKNDKIKVFIADDHPIFLSGLRLMIDAASSMEVIGEANDGEKALNQIEILLPDVAVLDLSMPKQNGFDIVRALRQKKIEINVIFLTMHDEEATLHSALDLGVKGYILKDSAIDEIVNGIKTVYKGKSFISPKMSTYLVSRIRNVKGFLDQTPSLNSLTPAEMKILRLIGEHKTTREIAESLFISHRTVDRHRYNICNKLKITGINSLLKFAIENKSKCA